MKRTCAASLSLVCLAAASAQSAVILTHDGGIQTPGLQGFRTITVTATSDVLGETITGFDFMGDPANTDSQTARGFFGPMNQIVLFGGALHTIFTDNNVVLDGQCSCNRHADSQFLFATNGASPVNSPSGFSSEGPSHLRALFGRDTGFGQSTPLAQLVIPDAATGTVNYRGVIGVNRGGTIIDLPEIAGVVSTDPFEGFIIVVDANLGERPLGRLITHTFSASEGPPPITWGNLIVTGPNGKSPTNPAILNPDGTFSWLANSDVQSQGLWTFDVTATNPFATDTGRLSVFLVVPEPSAAFLVGIALIAILHKTHRGH